jgi:hypothetical protein
VSPWKPDTPEAEALARKALAQLDASRAEYTG